MSKNILTYNPLYESYFLALGKKVKRVSDVNAMGVPAPPPVSQPYNPYSPQFAQNVDFQPQQPNYEYPSTPFQNQTPIPPNQNFQSPTTQYLVQNQQQNQSSIFTQPVVQDMAFQYGQQVEFQVKLFFEFLNKYIFLSSWLIKENK